LIQSTGGLVSSTVHFFVHTACTPIVVPIQTTSTVILGTLNVVGGIFSDATQKAGLFFVQKSSNAHDGASSDDANDRNDDCCHNDVTKKTNNEMFMQQQCKCFLDATTHVASCAIQLVSEISMDIPALYNSCKLLLPWQGDSRDNFGARSVDRESPLSVDSNIVNDNTSNEEDCSNHDIFATEFLTDTTLQRRGDDAKDKNERSSLSLHTTKCFSVRVCDLDIPSDNPMCKRHFHILTFRYEQLHFCHSSYILLDTVVEKLVDLALLLASDDDLQLNQVGFVQNPRIENTSRVNNVCKDSPIQWKEEGTTTKLLRKMQSTISNKDTTLEILEKEILVWSGCMKHKTSYYGHEIPIFKARCVITQISTEQLIELFMDSTKVKLYNKHSNGRKDICNLPCKNGLVTKIVENQTKIPFTNKIISMTTMLHARKIAGSNNDFIIVSRSVELNHNGHSKEDAGALSMDRHAVASPGDRNEILWGINIIRQVPGYPDKVDFTTMTQANSSAIPGFLARKLGLKCAIEFLNNVRGIPQKN
jgi:hypothetical protein